MTVHGGGLAATVADAVAVAGVPTRLLALHLLPLIGKVLEAQATALELSRNCLDRLENEGDLGDCELPDNSLVTTFRGLNEIMTEGSDTLALIDAIEAIVFVSPGDEGA